MYTDTGPLTLTEGLSRKGPSQYTVPDPLLLTATDVKQDAGAWGGMGGGDQGAVEYVWEPRSCNLESSFIQSSCVCTEQRKKIQKILTT